VQRVARARCTVEGRVSGEIGAGLLVLLGVAGEDNDAEAVWLAHKVAGLRIFNDEARHMNRDVREVGGAILAVPQFTLYGDARRGRRPDFTRAARPEQAAPLFERFCEALGAAGIEVARGVFQAHMEVELLNDGPVTLLVETPARAAGQAAAETESP
jgi:D-tyrosyl-tRNA(Tyr) deacylase